MFELADLKETRYVKELLAESKIEGKLESVPNFLVLGLTIEQIATALALDVEVVKKAAEKAEGKAEGKIEAKLESVPGFLAFGLTVEQIASVFGLDVEVIKKAAENSAVNPSTEENTNYKLLCYA